MKIKIGPYVPWISPYDIANWFRYIGLSEYRCDKIGGWFPRWVTRACNWVYSKRKRTIKIHIDDYDMWSLDHTLSLIIAPCLKKLKEQKHGTPNVEMEDRPEHLRNDEDWSKAAWEWVLDEMIWTFEYVYADEFEEDEAIEKANEERYERGIRLFAKYYRALWD